MCHTPHALSEVARVCRTAAILDAGWVAQTASRIVAVMEESRSTWQMWHARAEAQRHVRTTGVTAERASALVNLLVDEVLDHRSIALVACDQRYSIRVWHLSIGCRNGEGTKLSEGRSQPDLDPIPVSLPIF